MRITLFVAVAIAAVGIPALSLRLDDAYLETIVMLEQAEIDTADEINSNVERPSQMKAVVDANLTAQERRRIQSQMGFGPNVPEAVMNERLRGYAADFNSGRFDRIPKNVKQLAIERFGLPKLLALKERLMKMNLSKEQMIDYAKRELMREQRD